MNDTVHDSAPEVLAADKESLPESQRTLLADEREGYIAQRRGFYDQESPTSENLTGLALSGGGIRSATFCLGVMQAMARKDILDRFDYLSTVSGGGYIGSALTWALHKRWRQGKLKNGAFSVECEAPPLEFGVSRHNFPFGTSRRNPLEDAKEEETFDLKGGEGAGVITKVAKMSGAGSRGDAMLRYLRQHGKYLTPGDGINMLSLMGVILRGTLVSLLVFVPVLILFFALLEQFGLFAEIAGGLSWLQLGGLASFGFFALGAVVYAGFTRIARMAYSRGGKGRKGERESFYKARREFERWMPRCLALGAVFFLIDALPAANHWLIGQWQEKGGLIGLGSSLAGVLVAVMSFFRSGQSKPEKKKGPSANTLAWISSLLLGLGLLLFAAHWGQWIVREAPPLAWFDGFSSGWLWLLVALLLSLVVGHLTHVNYLSIHRYYRDRLMESYMPDVSRVVEGVPGAPEASEQADVGDLYTMCRCDEDSHAIGPYHLINCNLVLAESKVNKYRGRGGDNFLFSPRWCGSNATGWRKTEVYMQGRVTLATAMSISGAAANPNAGVGGEGATRQPVLSRLMTLLNLGLGVWVHNPAKPVRRHWASLWSPGSWALLPNSKIRETEKFLQVSDGGHFENLGIYELIRRKLRLIVACDAGADPDYEFGDLANTLGKIRSDFGVHIEFRGGLDKLMPKPPRPNDPNPIAYSKQACVVGTIHYPDGPAGKLILIKTAFIRGLPKDLLGFKMSHRDFPDQTTADQFFDEKQFEAYRVLGYHLGEDMIQRHRVLLSQYLPAG